MHDPLELLRTFAQNLYKRVSELWGAVQKYCRKVQVAWVQQRYGRQTDCRTDSSCHKPNVTQYIQLKSKNKTNSDDRWTRSLSNIYKKIVGHAHFVWRWWLGLGLASNPSIYRVCAWPTITHNQMSAWWIKMFTTMHVCFHKRLCITIYRNVRQWHLKYSSHRVF